MFKVKIFTESCKGTENCGLCIYVCPKNLFEPSKDMNRAGYIPPRLNEPEACTGCENCMLSCPDLAIVVIKEEENAP
jgi:2-oxoglutarate ferredoxin oxidoreductase subunit delta